ncbi:hypothetical protein [Bremerella sp. P1]|uniref:hypothetical protein n=1 Tax=Bremerella sp. P1 TaxID=3026424 RepID=UPI002368A664|nr:hypothetical protein [Bremerella sp. P1]WDI41243.1 hypothetical protein PSR63_22500 [Bremerella sp. P1]
MSGVTFSVAALWMILGASPSKPVVQDQVDLIEVNHYYDSQGRLIFDQVIFYEWSQSDARFHVTAWRLLKSSWQVPRKRWSDGAYTTTWKDGDVLRSVVGKNMRETWTQHDPELVERDYLPREYRRGLTPKIEAMANAEN